MSKKTVEEAVEAILKSISKIENAVTTACNELSEVDNLTYAARVDLEHLRQRITEREPASEEDFNVIWNKALEVAVAAVVSMRPSFVSSDACVSYVDARAAANTIERLYRGSRPTA